MFLKIMDSLFNGSSNCKTYIKGASVGEGKVDLKTLPTHAVLPWVSWNPWTPGLSL